MTDFWNADEAFPAAPAHPLLQCLEAALIPLQGVLNRWRWYEDEEAGNAFEVGLYLKFEPDGETLRILLSETLDACVYDVLVGQAPYQAGALLRLLEQNHDKEWKWRAVPEDARSVLVFLEAYLPLEVGLRDPATRVWEGVRVALEGRGLLGTLWRDVPRPDAIEA